MNRSKARREKDQPSVVLRMVSPLVAALVLQAVGCASLQDAKNGSAIPASAREGAEATATRDDSQGEITRLNTRIRDLEKQVAGLKRRLKDQDQAAEISRQSLLRRLEMTQAARDDAVQEVVRIRERIQGMASQAEASAMFAEARVLLDRMEEEAYNAGSLEDLDLSRTYVSRGKEALDAGNPGGAAYLFDLVSGIYSAMMGSDPRKVTVSVSRASLRKNPSDSSARIGSLAKGDFATGLEKSGSWMRVRTPSGQTGWLRRDQAH